MYSIPVTAGDGDPVQDVDETVAGMLPSVPTECTLTSLEAEMGEVLASGQDLHSTFEGALER